jgi:succinyl-diaminopimelate desuccinylase
LREIQKINDLKDEGLELLKNLISIPSVSPSGEHYKEIIDVLSDFFKKHGVGFEVIKVPEEYQRKHCMHAGENPRYILRAYVEGDRPWLQFNGHYDVVPGGPGWTVTEPFKPKVIGTRVYGRGSTDMKGGLVSMALALASLSDSEILVDAVFVPDEEIGGECGTGYYVETLREKPDYVVIAEPSTPENLWIGHKGGIWAKITAKGKTAHASTPWMGKNAFIAVAKIADYLENNYIRRIGEKISKYEYDFPESRRPTAMIGGEACVPNGKTNQVPGEAYFTIDRRLIIEENTDDVKKELEAALEEAKKNKGIKDIQLSVEYLTSMDPVHVPPGNKLSEAIKSSAKQVGLPVPREIICTGGLDLRYYITKGITGVSYGPGVAGTEHAPDEYTDYNQVIAIAKVYSLIPSKLQSVR